METVLSAHELARYLRDAVGSAEDVEWATKITAERVHLIAQGFADCDPAEMQALLLLYRCCMFAPVEEDESLIHWLAARPGMAPAPVSLIWAADENALNALLL